MRRTLSQPSKNFRCSWALLPDPAVLLPSLNASSQRTVAFMRLSALPDARRGREASRAGDRTAAVRRVALCVSRWCDGRRGRSRLSADSFCAPRRCEHRPSCRKQLANVVAGDPHRHLVLGLVRLPSNSPTPSLSRGRPCRSATPRGQTLGFLPWVGHPQKFPTLHGRDPRSF